MATPATRIDASHRIEGILRAGESVRFHGHMLGNVLSDDLFVVEADAIVEGDVDAERVVVMGTVVGAIRATHSVQVSDGGQVAGDITTSAFELVAGGRVRGVVESGATVSHAQSKRSQSASWSSPARRTSTTRSAPAPAPAKAKAATAKRKPTKKKGRSPARKRGTGASSREVVEMPTEVVEIETAKSPAKS
jgi:cytoskeletal protein CcmA (bactofilin family)